MTDQLGRHAAGTRVDGRGARAIPFTCSTSGAANAAVQAALPGPVLKPDETACEQAFAAGAVTSIAMLTTPESAVERRKEIVR